MVYDLDGGGGASRMLERTRRCLLQQQLSNSIVGRERRNKIIKAKGSRPDNITASTRV